MSLACPTAKIVQTSEVPDWTKITRVKEKADLKGNITHDSLR